MLKVSPERKDYYIRMLMDNLCKTQEENMMMIDELGSLQEQVKSLFHENSDLRHRLIAAGIEVPASCVTVTDVEETPASK